RGNVDADVASGRSSPDQAAQPSHATPRPRLRAPPLLIFDPKQENSTARPVHRGCAYSRPWMAGGRPWEQDADRPGEHAPRGRDGPRGVPRRNARHVQRTPERKKARDVQRGPQWRKLPEPAVTSASLSLETREPRCRAVRTPPQPGEAPQKRPERFPVQPFCVDITAPSDKSDWWSGGGSNPDLRDANATLSQLSYRPI